MAYDKVYGVKKYDKLFYLKFPCDKILNTQEQVKMNIRVCRDIASHEKLSILIPHTFGLCRRYKPDFSQLRAEANRMFDLPPPKFEKDSTFTIPNYAEFEQYMIDHPSAVQICGQYVEQNWY
jgi:hypothetical protein